MLTNKGRGGSPKIANLKSLEAFFVICTAITRSFAKTTKIIQKPSYFESFL